MFTRCGPNVNASKSKYDYKKLWEMSMQSPSVLSRRIMMERLPVSTRKNNEWKLFLKGFWWVGAFQWHWMHRKKQNLTWWKSHWWIKWKTAWCAALCVTSLTFPFKRRAADDVKKKHPDVTKIYSHSNTSLFYNPPNSSCFSSAFRRRRRQRRSGPDLGFSACGRCLKFSAFLKTWSKGEKDGKREWRKERRKEWRKDGRRGTFPRP